MFIMLGDLTDSWAVTLLTSRTSFAVSLPFLHVLTLRVHVHVGFDSLTFSIVHI